MFIYIIKNKTTSMSWRAPLVMKPSCGSILLCYPSYFPMMFQDFPIFTMVFLWIFQFPMVFLWISYGFSNFPWFSYGFPMDFPISHDFPMDFPITLSSTRCSSRWLISSPPAPSEPRRGGWARHRSRVVTRDASHRRGFRALMTKWNHC
jgi:hypothetical protein